MYRERDVEQWLEEQYRAEQAAVIVRRPAKSAPREPVTVRRD